MISPEKLTAEDNQFIEKALGRIPRGILSVSSRTPDGTPSALKMQCVVDKTPFPTHFWLCSPLLIEKVNFLESQRLVKPLEILIEQSSTLAKAFLEDQKRYQKIRNACLTDQDKEFLSGLGILELFCEKRGIGGIEDFTKIRCFHMQIAHLISDDNVIGQWLQDRFNLLNFSESLNEYRERIKEDKLIEKAF